MKLGGKILPLHHATHTHVQQHNGECPSALLFGGGGGGGGGAVSLMPCPYMPPSKKWSGEQSQISWAYYRLMCAMQYFHNACNHCCSRDTSRTERLNSGNQHNRDLKNGEEREARLARRRLIVNMLRDTAANGECSVYS